MLDLESEREPVLLQGQDPAGIRTPDLLTGDDDEGAKTKRLLRKREWLKSDRGDLHLAQRSRPVNIALDGRGAEASRFGPVERLTTASDIHHRLCRLDGGGVRVAYELTRR